MAAAVPVAATSYGDALVRVGIGRGVLWLLSAPQALDNRHIDHTGNRALLLRLAGPRGRTVAFTVLASPPPHASGNWLFGLPWGIAVLFALAAVALYRWLSGWRLGPPVQELDETAARFGGRPATDYVIAMAGLLRKARRHSDVLRLYQDRLKRAADGVSYRGSRMGGAPNELAISPQLLVSGPEHLSEADLMTRCREIVEKERDLTGSRPHSFDLPPTHIRLSQR